MLNPLGVPSRMNVGQILETHMGWAAKELGNSISKAVKEINNNKDAKTLEEALKNAYGEDDFKRHFGGMSGDDMKSAAKNITSGVPIATPVFDGAKELDVTEALERAGLDKSAQSVLFDGRTGEQFSRPVTVGVKYILKLHHLVDEKIHACLLYTSPSPRDS